MQVRRRDFLQLAAGAAAVPIAPALGQAQSYPTRPVQIIVGFPAGSGPDIVARLAAQWLGERLGQQFVVTIDRAREAISALKPRRAPHRMATRCC